jgi:hypothetical protein
MGPKPHVGRGPYRTEHVVMARSCAQSCCDAQQLHIDVVVVFPGFAAEPCRLWSVGLHSGMRVFDRDLIRGGHYGQWSCNEDLMRDYPLLT